MPNSDSEDDKRIPCKYGEKCYQKNEEHHKKYKHPKKHQENDNSSVHVTKKRKIQTENDFDSPLVKEQKNPVEIPLKPPQKIPNAKQFIKEKFLVEMPDDFYQFWDFCKELNGDSPSDAFKDVNLHLVGPYDVLAGKFCDIDDFPVEKYLLHWRYFYDPPEFQTVLKGSDSDGFHIGYVRDCPDEMPVLLASNAAGKTGIFQAMGANIFAAVCIYLENFKKTGDPFKKIHITKLQSALKKKCDELKIDLSENPKTIAARNKKIVTRTFNKIGLVVPYDKKTQLGYRQISVGNKELTNLLTKIQKALPEQKQKFLSELQQILTNANIATDECDFGTSIELGLNILAHGVESLNDTISRLLVPNYRFVNREVFAKIVESHMKNRKKGCDLSILQK